MRGWAARNWVAASIGVGAGLDCEVVVERACGDGVEPVAFDPVDVEPFAWPCAWPEPDEHAASTTHAAVTKAVAARRGRTKAGRRGTAPSEAQAS